MRFDLLAIEGAHDLAFIQRILKAFGFKQKKRLQNPVNPSDSIPQQVHCLIARTFPTNIEGDLLEQAKVVFPILYSRADAFIQTIKTTANAIPPNAELTADGKNEGKAVLHAMTSVLKPGKTLQASIADHNWVPSYASDFPAHFAPLVAFMGQLLEL